MPATATNHPQNQNHLEIGSQQSCFGKGTSALGVTPFHVPPVVPVVQLIGGKQKCVDTPRSEIAKLSYPKLA